MKFYLFGKIILASLLISFALTPFCQAAFIKDDVKQDVQNQANVAGMFGYEVGGSNQLLALVQTVINAFLSIIGVILLVYLLYAGYKWMTAHGEEEKVEQAKDTIKRAITGVIIIVAAYAISTFVVYRLQANILSGANNAPAPAVQSPVVQPND